MSGWSIRLVFLSTKLTRSCIFMMSPLKAETTTLRDFLASHEVCLPKTNFLPGIKPQNICNVGSRLGNELEYLVCVCVCDKLTHIKSPEFVFSFQCEKKKRKKILWKISNQNWKTIFMQYQRWHFLNLSFSLFLFYFHSQFWISWDFYAVALKNLTESINPYLILWSMWLFNGGTVIVSGSVSRDPLIVEFITFTYLENMNPSLLLQAIGKNSRVL